MIGAARTEFSQKKARLTHKIEALKKSRRELAGQKKELYAEYWKAQRQMREAVAVKANIDHLLGITDERENKAQER